MEVPANELAYLDAEGKLRVRFHPGQVRAWRSKKRFVLVSAGLQGGKTSYGTFWLWNEIKLRGPGDYLAVSPSYPLMNKKLLPEFLKLFRDRLVLGEYKVADRIFEFSPEGVRDCCSDAPEDAQVKVFFGHADDPESLESATAKAAWLDEAGQNRFRLGSYEAILGRVAIHQGRVLLTTTPYNLGWLKTKLYDPWDEARRNGRDHPDIDVIRFDSTENPAFPQSEYERAQREMPRWRFDMRYRGMFTRPAGMIYDCFDPARHCVHRMAVPLEWPRFWGLDFGAVNCACVKMARDPVTQKYHIYQSYWPGSKRTVAEHVASLLAGDRRPERCVGGSKSEGDWRQQFADAGLSVDPPLVNDVEVGVQNVWSLIARNDLLVFKDLEDLVDELQSYSRELDDAGSPTEVIEAKETYHRLDSLRYICTYLSARSVKWVPPPRVERRPTPMLDLAKKKGLFGLKPD